MEHWRSKTRLSSKLKPWTATNQTELQKKPIMGTRGETETRETKVNTKINVKVKLNNITTSRHKRRPSDKTEGRYVKPHHTPEDGYLEEAGIKEDLEEREREGGSQCTSTQHPNAQSMETPEKLSGTQTDPRLHSQSNKPIMADRRWEIEDGEGGSLSNLPTRYFMCFICFIIFYYI